MAGGSTGGAASVGAGVLGQVDGFEPPNRLYGWVTDPARNTARKLDVVITRGNTELGRTTANLPRPDLAAIGDGAIAFDLTLSQPLAPADIALGAITIEAVDATQHLGPIPFGRELRSQLAAATLTQSLDALAAATRLVDPHALPALLRTTLPPGTAVPCQALLDALAQANTHAAAAPSSAASKASAPTASSASSNATTAPKESASSAGAPPGTASPVSSEPSPPASTAPAKTSPATPSARNTSASTKPTASSSTPTATSANTAPKP